MRKSGDSMDICQDIVVYGSGRRTLERLRECERLGWCWGGRRILEPRGE